MIPASCEYYSSVWCNSFFSIVGFAITLTMIYIMIEKLFRGKQNEKTKIRS